MPSPDVPLQGSCACGTVRFEVTAPFETAGHCHCHRCQQRSGALWSTNAQVGADAVAVVAGAEEVRTWRPPDGLSKSFCTRCGGHVFSGDPGQSGTVGVRLGAVHGDPGIRPQWRQWVESAPEWAAIPDDGLPRHPRSRPR
jgi:hypothetical protein